MTVSTKDGQILYVNLYSQVYFPDYIKMMQDIKGDDPFGNDNSNEESRELDASGFLAESGKSVLGSLDARPKPKARTVGLVEEGSDDITLEEWRAQKGDMAPTKTQLDQLEQRVRIERIDYHVVADGFHKGEISAMDICVQRPIIATLSKMDSTVRIWNYHTGVCELLVDQYIRF